MKHFILLICAVFAGCLNPVENEEPISPIAEHINFITEWRISGDTVTVIPLYHLMPRPVQAEKIFLEFYENNIVVRTDERPFGMPDYKVQYDNPSQIQLIYAYIFE